MNHTTPTDGGNYPRRIQPMTSANVENQTIPTATHTAQYPVTVLLPDGTQHTRCKVFATPEGLAVYWAVPTDGITPDWFSPIAFDQTSRPRTGYMARVGWEVFTQAGAVTVTAEGGCGCGWPLKRWMPAFAQRRLAWPKSV